jgi:hypothetical protein
MNSFREDASMVKQEEPDEFDIAAAEAERKLIQLLEGFNAEEKKGAMAIFQWHAANYLKAGHKRLGRIHVKLAKRPVTAK